MNLCDVYVRVYVCVRYTKTGEPALRSTWIAVPIAVNTTTSDTYTTVHTNHDFKRYHWVIVSDCEWWRVDCEWIVNDCEWLWVNMSECGWLWGIVRDCEGLWVNVSGLWVIVSDCEWLWVIVRGLWVNVFGLVLVWPSKMVADSLYPSTTSQFNSHAWDAISWRTSVHH